MRILGLAIIAVSALVGAGPAFAQSTTSAGYDAQGRLRCVQRQVDGQTRTTTYGDYDLSGNRQTVATATAGSCPTTSGTPPTPPSDAPGAITVTNPADTLDSEEADVLDVAALGSSSITGALHIVGAQTQGATGACGAAYYTTGSLTYTAPEVTGSSSIICRVAYALRHSVTGAQRTGRVTYTILPETGGGGGEHPGGGCPPLEVCVQR